VDKTETEQERERGYRFAFRYRTRKKKKMKKKKMGPLTMDTIFDLIEEAKLRFLWWSLCIFAISYFL